MNTPSVITSMRVRSEMRLCSLTLRPIVSPTFSPRVAAMRAAAARAASLRGSRTRIFPPPVHGSCMSASGTRVVLPAPGGATSTARVFRLNAARKSGSASSIGSGTEKSVTCAPSHLLPLASDASYAPTEVAVCKLERSSLTPGPMVEETAARNR